MTFTNFIKRPVLSTVVSVFFVLLGTIGLISLPIEQYPDIAPPTISVMANYQGADAQTVLNSVVTPLEESINGVENMTYIQSTATNAGLAMITVYFKQGSDPNMASVNVQNRVARVVVDSAEDGVSKLLTQFFSLAVDIGIRPTTEVDPFERT